MRNEPHLNDSNASEPESLEAYIPYPPRLILRTIRRRFRLHKAAVHRGMGAHSATDMMPDSFATLHAQLVMIESIIARIRSGPDGGGREEIRRLRETRADILRRIRRGG